MHPWDRLQRRVAGQQLSEPRALELALFKRMEDRHPSRIKAFEPRVVRIVKARNNRNTARPAPNAPLLKRVVRRPYRMDGTRGRRQPVRAAVPWEQLTREPTPSIAAVLDEARTPMEFSKLVREAGEMHRPTRDLPSVDAYLTWAWSKTRREEGR